MAIFQKLGLNTLPGVNMTMFQVALAAQKIKKS